MSLSFLTELAATEKRRKIVAFYGGGIVTVCTGVWAVFTFFVHPDHKDEPRTPVVSAQIVQSPSITVSPTFNPPAQPPAAPVVVPIEIRITDARKRQMYADVNIKPDDAFTLPVLATVYKSGSQEIQACRAELWVPTAKNYVVNTSFVDSPTRFNFDQGISRKELELFFDITLAIARMKDLQVRIVCGDRYVSEWVDLK
jgi:hypothetical protein